MSQLVTTVFIVVTHWAETSLVICCIWSWTATDVSYWLADWWTAWRICSFWNLEGNGTIMQFQQSGAQLAQQPRHLCFHKQLLCGRNHLLSIRQFLKDIMYQTRSRLSTLISISFRRLQIVGKCAKLTLQMCANSGFTNILWDGTPNVFDCMATQYHARLGNFYRA